MLISNMQQMLTMLNNFSLKVSTEELSKNLTNIIRYCLQIHIAFGKLKIKFYTRE